MFKSLFQRLFVNNVIVVLVTIITLMSALMFLMSNFTYERQYETDMKAADTIEKMTVYLQIENRDFRNYKFYNDLINQYSQFTDSDIIIVDSIGEIYTSTLDVNSVPTDYIDKVLSGNILKNRSNFEGFFEKNVFVVGVPIRYRNGVVGGMFFLTDVPEIREKVNDYFPIIIIACLISIIVGLILTFFTGKRISKPIKELNTAVLEIASGNFSKRLSNSRGEIGQLASSFNYMADSLENLEKMRTSFVSDVSHELRTPMTSISGFVGGILDGTIPKEKESEYLQIVYDESVRLTKMTNDMLQMSKMQSEEYKLDVSTFDINELIRTCIIQLGQKIDDKNLEPEIEFEPEKIMVIADKDAIKRVVINILENAVKFSFENTALIIKTKVTGKKAQISIGNFGIGIKSSEIGSIFDRFYKTDKSRSKDKTGAGLGLSLAKNIMKLHNQDIWADSIDAKEGSKAKYTEFNFTLALK